MALYVRPAVRLQDFYPGRLGVEIVAGRNTIIVLPLVAVVLAVGRFRFWRAIKGHGAADQDFSLCGRDGLDLRQLWTAVMQIQIPGCVAFRRRAGGKRITTLAAGLD